MLSFGGHLCGSEFLALVPFNLDKALLGAVWGAATLGYYGRAFQLILLPVQQINFPAASVAIPALSRLQGDVVAYRNYYKRFVEILLSASIPISIFCIVAAEPIILTVLGDQWTPCVSIFRALVPATLMQAMNCLAGTVFVSTGRSDKQLRATTFLVLVSLVAYALTLPLGAVALALGVSVASMIHRPLSIIYAVQGSPLRMSDVTSATWRPCVSSALAGTALWLSAVPKWFGGVPALGLFTQAALFGLVYVLAWMSLPGGRLFLRNTISGMRLLLIPSGTPSRV